MPAIPMNVIWLILFVIFVIAEIATAGLVSIWFCFGALAAMLAASFGGSFGIQAGVFLVVSIILLILTKPLVKKLHTKVIVTYARAIIGEQGVVTETINGIEGTGAVKIQGKIWSARPRDENQVIDEGNKVKILDIQGVKVIVEKIEEKTGEE